MRDIEQYAKDYIESAFELRYQVKYRRRKVLELLEGLPHESVLEIGCGMEPISSVVPGCRRATVVKPSAHFAQAAREVLAGTSLSWRVVQVFFEDVAEEVAGQHHDVMLCSRLLHEAEDPSRLLQAIFSAAVSSGGRSSMQTCRTRRASIDCWQWRAERSRGRTL